MMRDPRVVADAIAAQTTRARATVALLMANALIAAVAVPLLLRQLLLLNSAAAGAGITAVLGTIRELQLEALGAVEGAVRVLTVIAFLLWSHKAVANLRLIGSCATRYSPGMAVGAWFVPLANLLVPYQAMKDVWQRSESGNVSHSNPIGRGAPVVGWWWLVGITSALLSGAANVASKSVQNLQQLLWLARLEVAGELSLLVAAVLTIAVVRGIDQRQRRIAAGAPSETDFGAAYRQTPATGVDVSPRPTGGISTVSLSGPTGEGAARGYWLCAQCKRHVPVRLVRCRCGTERAPVAVPLPRGGISLGMVEFSARDAASEAAVRQVAGKPSGWDGLDNRTRVGLVGLTVFAALGLFPPWIETTVLRTGYGDRKTETASGHHFILSPPTRPVKYSTHYTYRIDYARLLVLWTLVGAVTGGVVLALRLRGSSPAAGPGPTPPTGSGPPTAGSGSRRDPAAPAESPSRAESNLGPGASQVAATPSPRQSSSTEGPAPPPHSVAGTSAAPAAATQSAEPPPGQVGGQAESATSGTFLRRGEPWLNARTGRVRLRPVDHAGLDGGRLVTFLETVGRHLEGDHRGRRFPSLWRFALALADEQSTEWSKEELASLLRDLDVIEAELRAVPARSMPTFAFWDEEGYPNFYSRETPDAKGNAHSKLQWFLVGLRNMAAEAYRRGHRFIVYREGPAIRWWKCAPLRAKLKADIEDLLKDPNLDATLRQSYERTLDQLSGEQQPPTPQTQTPGPELDQQKPAERKRSLAVPSDNFFKDMQEQREQEQNPELKAAYDRFLAGYLKRAQQPRPALAAEPREKPVAAPSDSGKCEEESIEREQCPKPPAPPGASLPKQKPMPGQARLSPEQEARVEAAEAELDQPPKTVH